jgi:hypothetical protein
MEQGPDFRHYESFVAVAEECRFRKAAEKLHITQTALSGWRARSFVPVDELV